jgi:potassium efflux system protein
MGDELFTIELPGFLDTVLPMLERPAVQRQLLTAALIVLLSWLLPKTIQKRLTQRISLDSTVDEHVPARWRTLAVRLVRALRQTYFPLLGILFSAVFIRLFDSQGWLYGLLDRILLFFLLLLGYRILVAILYVVLSESQAHKYHSRFLRPLFVIVVLVGLNQVLSGIEPIAEITLFTVTGQGITLESIFIAGVVFYFFLACSWLVDDLLDGIVLPRFHLERGISNTISTIAQYSIISVGFLATLATLGLDLSSLAIIGAGLSVGIGFGLQGPVADFVSGLLLLFERTVRPGDMIEMGTRFGTIESVSARFTTVRTPDNIELIVPNKDLLATTITTYTHAERSIRLLIPVGVSYDSDPSEVREVLLDAASRHGLGRTREINTPFRWGELCARKLWSGRPKSISFDLG